MLVGLWEEPKELCRAVVVEGVRCRDDMMEWPNLASLVYYSPGIERRGNCAWSKWPLLCIDPGAGANDRRRDWASIHLSNDTWRWADAPVTQSKERTMLGRVEGCSSDLLIPSTQCGIACPGGSKELLIFCCVLITHIPQEGMFLDKCVCVRIHENKNWGLSDQTLGWGRRTHVHFLPSLILQHGLLALLVCREMGRAEASPSTLPDIGVMGFNFLMEKVSSKDHIVTLSYNLISGFLMGSSNRH